MTSQPAASVDAPIRRRSQRASVRENGRMPAVSQPRDSLIEFANHFRQPPAPGIEVVDTPRYRLTLQPDYPMPGPNSVAWIRCTEAELDDVVDEVHTTVSPRRLPLMWVLDPGTEPATCGDLLARRGILPEPRSPRVAVMVLPVEHGVASPPIRGLELHDALAEPESFRRSDAVNAEAFADRERDPERQERRRANQLAAGNRRVLLATIDGEPAGSAGMTLYPPHGAILNGGAVRARFRGRGVYRALVAARMDIARAERVPGVQVWAGPMSAPILERLGFEPVGWRTFHLDLSTV